ncbi:MAG: double-strand break repair helicase AddA, partial [Pseudomonadota bacterium]
LLASSTNDIKVGKRLQALGAVCWDSLPELEDLFVYGPKTKTAPLRAKVGKVPTQGLQKTLGPQLNDLNAFMHRLEAARPMRLGLIASERSVALHAFAAAFLERYETAKNTRGWLDFDDLITKARALLIDKEVAAWVLYRIDGGIDHILVDEAQDTSRPQWEVIEALADEFHSGEGARDALDRTLFVVGDKKQSIYSFQGADPQEFDRKRALFEQKFTDAGKPFQRQSLAYSFRSSSAILRLVDTVFDPRRRHDFGKDTEHLAFKTTLPGRVDLWPLIEQEAQPDTPKWTDPVDRPSPARPNAVLAEKIADTIKKLTDPNNPSFIPEDGPGPNTPIKRAIRPGDFLILVQRRSDLFAEIIRACKAANLPIAGADRLKVGGELAVKDIAALLSFLATPDDDLSLACVLKSPLFDWDEQMLFKLAHYRTKKHLWEALRGQASTYPETVSVLTDLRAQVDFLRPYDLIERILTKHDGRRKLITRLGAEAEDGINALLTQALAFERNDVPSLTGFIEWMRTDDLEIKRQIDSASDQIRVMTVHGAKGLEAPIVILPETQKRDVRLRSAIVGVGGKPFWKPKSEHIPGPMQPTLDALKDAERAERLRLLYVAITRAEKWLIVAAAGNLSKDKSDWYQIIQEAMGHANAVAVDDDGCLRLQEGDWDNLETIPTAQAATKTNPLDPVFTQSQPLFCHPQDVLSPSDLGGAKALPDPLGQDSETARAFGSLVHGLLEQLAPLSPAQRRDMVRNIEANESGPRIRDALAEVQRVLTSDHLLPLPNAVTLLEVPVTATIRGMRLHGVIDRLVICDNAIQLIDYKTNRVVPASADDCPEGLLRQMGAYQEILEAIYPAHQITACLLWTADATLMPLPNKLIASALDRSPYLDASGGRS